MIVFVLYFIKVLKICRPFCHIDKQLLIEAHYDLSSHLLQQKCTELQKPQSNYGTQIQAICDRLQQLLSKPIVFGIQFLK